MDASFDDQSAFQARFEWGEAGVSRLATISDLVVIDDVLSFATAVDVAVSRGAEILPFSQRGAPAEDFARREGALLATGRIGPGAEPGFSLSPASLQVIPPGTRLVLPSPNGARISMLAAEHGATVLVGCLRNASAVAAACRARGGSVAVIACGERWAGAGDATGSLRPAAEDLIGAGAILAALSSENPSPEARVAIGAFRTIEPELCQFLLDCSSGKELRGKGFGKDIEIAAQLDVSTTVPWLQGTAIGLLPR